VIARRMMAAGLIDDELHRRLAGHVLALLHATERTQ
jgi:hypothetical protein